ncbi:dihydrolipoyl dehydrogenase, partial [Mycoplasma flocculare]|nr:dihydrolipoyl dehydrogenase [Mesomycoplasma flocculare]
AAEVAEVAKSSEQYGIKAEFQGIDIEGVLAYKDDIISRNYKGLQGLVKVRGVDYISGEGKLTAPDTIEVSNDEGGVTVTGKNIILATG